MDAIVTRGLTKRFGRRAALDDVSISIPRGAFLSIFGPNGAGKSTLLNILTTLSRPTSGSLEVLGIDALAKPESLRPLIGFISHKPLLYGDLTAHENLEFFASLYGVEASSARITDLLHTVELAHRRHDYARTFSRGMTQRLSIARALIHDPRLIFMDEPYAGLDPHAVDIFDQIIDRVREDRTIVMVSHDLRKGFDVCSHALILADGREILFGERTSFDADEFERTYLATVGIGVA